MGANDRASTGSVIQQLLDHPQAFNLFQAISLLEAEASRLRDGRVEEYVRLRSHVSFAFQPSDIRSIEVQDEAEPIYTLWTSVMGLAGSGGPLPAAFTEMLLARAAKRDHATADFLDVFNQQFLYFLYRSRQKNHPGLGALPSQSATPNVLNAIGSLGLIPWTQDQAPLWLRHAGLMGGAPRSMTGLLALLGDRLGLHIKGRQFIGQWLPADAISQGRLDRSHALNGTAILGRRVWDQAAGIALQIAVTSSEQLRSCLPGGLTYRYLKQLIAAYVRQELSVSLILLPSSKAMTPPRLDVKSGMRLGWTSRLTSQQTALAAAVRLKLTLHDF